MVSLTYFVQSCFVAGSSFQVIRGRGGGIRSCCSGNSETTFHPWVSPIPAWATLSRLVPIFYPMPFWPTGIVIACVCVCVCICQLLLVRMITHHTFRLESPDLDEKMQNILLKVPIVLGADWAWPSMSNLTSFKNSVYLHRFCVFEIFVRCAKTEFV